MADETPTSKPDFKRAKFLFDNISAATYQGAQFRYLLATDPAARAAAEALHAKLVETGQFSACMVPESEYPNDGTKKE